MLRLILVLSLSGAVACLGEAAATRPSAPVPQGGLGIRGRGFPASASGDASAGTLAASGTASVMGSIDKDAIREAIRDHAPDVRSCYEKQLVLDPGLEGIITVKWVIGPDGRATSPQVQAARTTLSSETVVRCILERIVTWQFPRPAGGGMAVVTYPWVLRIRQDPSR